MYVSRQLALYRSSPELLGLPPPEGPGSGYLVHGWGWNGELPSPHNRVLVVAYDGGEGDFTVSTLFIPVINQPLSTNRYYLIPTEGDSPGLACEASTEEDTVTYCCCAYIKGRRPRVLNPLDPYQQFEVVLTGSKRYPFKAIPVAPDGVATGFLGQSWNIYPSSSSKHQIPELPECCGLISIDRDRLPGFEFPISRERSLPEIVGKWACPFVFIRDGNIRERIKKSAFYEMTLEQRWERVLTSENGNKTSSVAVNAVVATEVVKVGGKDVIAERDEENRVMWFWSVDDQMRHTRVGLDFVIVERMMWEQERVVWVEGNDKQVIVCKEEVFTEGGKESCSWRRYGCYVLVERFVLKRYGVMFGCVEKEESLVCCTMILFAPLFYCQCSINPATKQPPQHPLPTDLPVKPCSKQTLGSRCRYPYPEEFEDILHRDPMEHNGIPTHNTDIS